MNESARVQSANHTSQQSGNKQQIGVIQHEKPTSIISIFKKGLKMPVALEELFPIDVWRHADSMGWLAERTEIVRLNEFTALGTTFEDFCKSRGISDDELFMLVKCVPMESKEKFAKYVVALPDAEQKIAFASFENLVKRVEDFFGLAKP